MMGRKKWEKAALPILLVLLVLVSGCVIDRSYRPADQKTIRDFNASETYRKRIGILAITNTTVFTSGQISAPFMESFLSNLKSAAADVQVLLPDQAGNTPLLLDPPRNASGNIDVSRLSARARQEGLNAIVSPMIMDIRTSKKDTGFWFFREVAYILQIQTAAAAYDAITGARLSLGILTDTIDISEKQSEMIKNGQETTVEGLVEIAKEMGDALGEQMGQAIEESRWMTSVASIENGVCVLPAGSAVGIATGDRFSILDTRGTLTGLDDQRYIVPGAKIGQITIQRVTDRQAFGTPVSGSLPPVGSIVVPDK
jgi:hypothetical protein